MRLVKIYALVNPFNNRKFYVGATEKPLDIRLRQHLLSMNSRHHKGECLLMRQELLDKCKEVGKSIRIVLLEEVRYKHSEETELRWFYSLSKKNNLYQKHPGRFKSQNAWT